MVLEFLKGAQQPTAQEAVAFVTDDDSADTYNAGEVAANVSELVAVNGAEDVLAYVNGDSGAASAAGTDVAGVTVGDNGVVLDPAVSATSAGDAATIDVDGGLFFNVDEAVEGSTLDPANFENDGDISDDETLFFTYTAGEDDLQYVVALGDGIPMVLQASGF